METPQAGRFTPWAKRHGDLSDPALSEGGVATYHAHGGGDGTAAGSGGPSAPVPWGIGLWGGDGPVFAVGPSVEPDPA
jgi:hypothetical protein